MTPSPTASGPSAEAMEAAHKFLASAGHGHCCCLMCETAIARAIDAAVKAEREECAKVADVSAKEDWRHARSAERKGDDDVGYLREAKAMCAEDIAEAIRARTP